MLINLLTIIFVIFLFAVLVIGHELGHFILAKRNGIKVEEFGLGFPPRLGHGKQIGETLYTLNWLPLGGFVRLAGEDGDETTAGTFAAASLWAKSKTLLAGVVMNLIMAWFILFVLSLTGLPGLGAQFEPSFLHPSYAQPKQLLLSTVGANSPAASLGLKRGDFILAANGTGLTSDEQLRDFTTSHAGQTVALKVRHNGNVETRQVKLRQPSEQGILGVTTQPVYKLRYSLGEAVIAAAWITGALFVATVIAVVGLIIHIPSLIMGLFSSHIPAVAATASGPIGIIVILTSLSSLGLSYIFLFMANISVALAGFNVLPLPALDGGRLAVAIVRRLTKGRISTEAEGIYHGIGFLALLGLVALISIYDLRKFF